MSTAYSQAELDAMARAMVERQPPPMTQDQIQRAWKIVSFALFGDGRGVVVRFGTDEGSLCSFSFHPLVARHLAKAIVDIARLAAWTWKSELLHPYAVARSAPEPDPDAETEWERLLQEGVAIPDQGTFDKSPKVMAINGHGSRDEFAVSLALDKGTARLRLNPLIAWKLS